MENPIKMDDLGVPLFLETPIYLAVFFFLSIALPGSEQLYELRLSQHWSHTCTGLCPAARAWRQLLLRFATQAGTTETKRERPTKKKLLVKGTIKKRMLAFATVHRNMDLFTSTLLATCSASSNRAPKFKKEKSRAAIVTSLFHILSNNDCQKQWTTRIKWNSWNLTQNLKLFSNSHLYTISSWPKRFFFLTLVTRG